MLRALGSLEVVAVTVILEGADEGSAAKAEHFFDHWDRWNCGIPLKVLHTEYASVVQPIVAFIDELRAEVAREISPIARPRELHVVPELPKTRSGKIMRRLLRDIVEKRELGDTSTLLDPGVFAAIRAAK